MVKTFLFFAAMSILLTGCKQKVKPFEQETSAGKSGFFPVTQYLLGQIKELDTLPLTPLKITTINGKADSLWLKGEDSRVFVQRFVTPVIDSISYHSYFSEKSFLDQTINAFTFSYDPVRALPASMEIKHWDVYVDPATNKVTRIYLLKQLNDGTSYQLIWKTGYYCQVTTIIEKKGEAPKIKEEKLIWNFND